MFLGSSSNGFCYFSKQSLAQKYPIFSLVFICFIPFLYREPPSSATKFFIVFFLLLCSFTFVFLSFPFFSFLLGEDTCNFLCFFLLCSQYLGVFTSFLLFNDILLLPSPSSFCTANDRSVLREMSCWIKE